MKKCWVEGCDNEIKNKTMGVCQKHYLRLKRYGRTYREKPIGRQKCKVEGCNENVHGNKMCKIHYDRWYNNNKR